MEEFYLRDYLRVIWQKRFIILAATILAGGLGAGYAFTGEPEYRVNAQLVWNGAPTSQLLYPIWSSERSQMMSVSDQLSDLRVNDAFLRLRSFSGGSSRITVLRSSDTMNLSLTGPEPAEDLEHALTQHISNVNDSLSAEIISGYEQSIQTLDFGMASLQNQKDYLLALIRSSREEQLEALLNERLLIEARMISASPIELTSIESELNALNVSIVQLQLELASTVDISRTSFDAQLAEIDGAILAYELLRDEIQMLIESDWSALSILKHPVGSSSPVGQSVYLVVAIALILGMISGTLLSFFMHFIQTPEKSS